MTEAKRTSEPDEDGRPPLLEFRRFPWVIDVELEEARRIIERLLDDDGGRFPAGSSFVVDANAKPGWRRIWLSRVSMTRLEGAVT